MNQASHGQSPPSRAPRPGLSPEVRVALVYAIVGLLWIYFSDLALLVVLRDQQLVNAAQTYKGWAFVGVTAAILFLYVRRELSRRRRTEQALRESESKFRRLFESNMMGVMFWDRSGRILDANDAFLSMVGHNRADVLEGRVSWKDLTPPEHGHLDERGLREIEARGVCAPFEKEYFHRDGRRVPILIGGAFVEDSREQGVCFVLDMTRQKRVEALSASQNHALEMIASGLPLSDILNALTHWAETDSPGSLCSILLLDDDGVTLRNGSSGSLPEDFSRAVEGLRSGEGVGSCGTAVARKAPVIVTDIATDPLWASGRDLGRLYGLRACWSVPIFSSEKRVLGTVAVYFREPRSPQPADLELMQTLAGLAALAIERRRADETRESLRRLAGRLTASLTMDELGAILARECRRLFVFDAFFFDLVDAGSRGHMTIHAEDTPSDGVAPVRLDAPAEEFSPRVQPLFQGEPVLINRAAEDGNVELRPWGFKTRRSRSLMFAPIRWEGRCIGVLSVQSYTDSRYGHADLELLQLIADQCGPALARVQSEAALRQSEQRFRLLSESASVGIFLQDTEGRCLYTNPAWQRIAGMSLEESLGQGWVNAIHPEDRPRAAAEWERQKAGGNFQAELRFLQPDGAIRWVFARTAAISDPAGRATGYVGTIEDLTARKQAEEEVRKLNAELERRVSERTAQLEAANKELEAFSYSVSHDLRAPLRHVTGFANLLVKQPLIESDATSRRMAGTISQAARRMGQLIDDLLIFSRMGRTELHATEIDTDKLVREVVEETRVETGGRTIAWRLGKLPVIHGDRAMLRQVFVNLINNAVKYSRTQSQAVIEVRCQDTPGEFVFSVHDNGVGFDMQYAHKLFGVFQRLHREDEFEGTGIGLANVRRVISRHGGRTWAEGRPGAGASFYFSLPRSGAPLKP